MRQTFALLVDAYRELNSKKLFWIVLILSGIVVLAFAGIGINEKGITLLWWQFDFFGLTSDEVPPDKLYKTMFSSFGVGFWLSWLASILALVSTASMIPDFIVGGAIELTLSKPIGRVRLFLTKFMTGLLFVGLQVAVFTAACFLVIGIRGKSWEPSVFLAIPLVVLCYSYLFSVCVLLGLLTRSTIASLLLTLLFWFVCFALNTTDALALQLREMNAVNIERLTTRISRAETSASNRILAERMVAAKEKGEEPGPDVPPTREEIEKYDTNLANLRKQMDEATKNRGKILFFSRSMVAAKTAFPKTNETIGLLERVLQKQMELPKRADDGNEELLSMANNRVSQADRKLVEERLKAALRGRNVWWVVGTSVMFEVVVLGIATWIFKRRDF